MSVVILSRTIVNIVRSWLRRLAGATRAFARAFDPKQPRRWLRAGTAVAIIAVLVGAAATWRLSSDAVMDAARSLAYDSSDVAQDDGAGDASTPPVDAERYLPVPAPLDDERVLAALGP